MKRLISLILLVSSLGFANEINTDVDLQLALEKSFQEAQKAHFIKTQGTGISPTARDRVVATQEESVFKFYYESANNYLIKGFLQKYGILDWAKRALRTVKGIKSTPPIANGLFYIYNTAGTMPEVFWIPDGAADPDGTIDRFEFNYGDGTSQVIPLSDWDTVNNVISHLYTSAGTYNASVKIVDNTGDSTTYTSSITITTSNKMPIAKFNVTNNVAPDFLKVDFTSQAIDPDGSLIRYAWRFGDGSADNIGAGNTNISRTYTAAGTYNVRFQARDNNRAQMSVTIPIYVGVTPPGGGFAPASIVDANTFAGAAPLSVEFDGEKSFDIGGSITAYEWNFGDYWSPLNTSYESKPRYLYTQPGTYYGSLKTTDNGGRTGTRFFTVYVLPGNGNPASAEVIAYPQSLARTFLFESSYNGIHAAVPSNYLIWDFGDGSPQEKRNYPTHTYALNGTYTVTLKVYDARGSFQQIQKQIVVDGDQSAPASFFLSDKNNIETGETVNFITQNPGLVSSTAVATWDFGDGSAPVTGLHQNLLNVSHSYNQKGFYPISLAVTDINGKSSYSKIYVVVQSTGKPVQARINASQTIGQIPFPVRLDATASFSSAGNIDQYYWYVTGGPNNYYSNQAIATSTMNTGGPRYVSLIVVDDQGNIGLDNITLTVIDPAQVPPNNIPPSPVINISYPNLSDPTFFMFDAYQSSDSNGDRIASYEWNLDGLPIGRDPESLATIQQNGEHTITLRIADQWGVISSVQKKFTKSDSTGFKFGFDSSPKRPVVRKNVYFMADEETVQIPNAVPVDYKWDFGDGSKECCSYRVNHFYTTAGTYIVRLTVKDSLNQVHTFSKSLTVETAVEPVVVITAKDAGGVSEVYGNQTFYWNTFPLTVNFDLLERSIAQGQGLVSANWNFGDNNSRGYGLNPSYTYQKPGTYTVTVTARDAQNKAGATTMNIVVGSDNCSDVDGVEGCLTLNNSFGNVLPMTANRWLIGHDAGEALSWALVPGDTDFATLETLDEETPVVYNISSSIAMVDSQQLKMLKSTLQGLGVNFNKAYKLTLTTKLSDGSDYSAMFPRLYFGVGTANITTNESDIILTISGTTGYKKYIDLNANTAVVLSNLPVGTYSIYAEKGDRVLSEDFEITSSTPVSVNIDISSLSLKLKQWSKQIRAAQRFKEFKDDPTYKSMLEKRYNPAKLTKSKSEFPGYAIDYCGNRAPFPIAKDRKPSGEKKHYANYFDSVNLNAQKEFFRLVPAYGKKLKLVCGLISQSNQYKFYEWMYRDSVLRCEGEYPPGPNTVWNELKARVVAQARKKVKISYTIRDWASGKETKGSYSFSAQELMAQQGLSLATAMDSVGLLPLDGETTDFWGLKFEKDITIPEDYHRAKASFEMESEHIAGTLYGITCAFEKSTEIVPAVEEVNALPGNHEKYTSEFNGAIFLNKYFFPAHTSTADGGIYQHKPNIFKAKLRLKILKAGYDKEDFTGAKVFIKKGDNVLGTHWYDFVPASVQDNEPDQDHMLADIEMDAAHFSGDIVYDGENLDPLEIRIIPTSTDFDDADADGIPKFMTPLFDVKELSSSLDVCANGFYSSPISAYAQTKLIEAMKQLTSNGVNFRCNDMSLPWGGVFSLIITDNAGTRRWSHKGHDMGLNADIRYFNSSPSAQDFYDGDSARKRIDDLNEYLKFSAWAKDVAENAARLSEKTEVYNACMNGGMPLAPCSSGMTLSQLDHLKILQYCQWHDTSMSVCYFTPPSIPIWRSAIIRYSTWAKKNMETIPLIRTVVTPLMSSGAKGVKLTSPSGLTIVDMEWQKMAIDFGQWPDGSTIYNVSGSIIQDTGIGSCLSGCDMSQYFNSIYPDHYNHIHITK